MTKKDEKSESHLAARVLLALQQEDDNPYDVDDEMLVAFSEGKLTRQESEVIKRCIAHSPETLAASVSLTREHFAGNSDTSLKEGNRSSMLTKLFDCIKAHKNASIAGLGSLLATSFGVLLLVTGNSYQQLDAVFADYEKAHGKVRIHWEAPDNRFGSQNDSLYQTKSANTDYFELGVSYGVKEGLLRFVEVNTKQKEQLERLPSLSAHCNNSIPISRCELIQKQGSYVGKWMAMNYVACKANQSIMTNDDLKEITQIVTSAKLASGNLYQQTFNSLYSAATSERCAIVYSVISHNALNL